MNHDTKLRSLIAPTDEELHQQLSGLRSRELPQSGSRQVNFTPAEVILCLAASTKVKWNSYGGNNAHTAPTPIPELARLFGRSPASVLSKMGNLFGGRTHGGVSEVEAAEWYFADPARLEAVLVRLLAAARKVGVNERQLPDFLVRTGGRS